MNDISIQSRPATGVRLQKLDDEDAIAAVALVPPALQDNQEEDNGDPATSIEAEIAAEEAAEAVIEEAAAEEE